MKALAANIEEVNILPALQPPLRCGGAVLVTGASGFIGSVITAALRSRGFSVVAHARRACTGIDWVEDLGQPLQAYQPLPRRIVAVIHCAAAIPSRSSAFDDNVRIATHLCARLSNIRAVQCVIHLSSVAVYKSPARGQWIISEDAELVDVEDPNTSPYADSKRASELALDAFAQQRPEVTLVHLRASSVYGRGMVTSTLLPTLASRALRHEPMQLRGPRGYVQNFVHVEDVAELAITLLTGNDSYCAVNAFSEDTYGLSTFAHLVRDALGSRSVIIDNTDGAEWPTPVFVNVLARRFQPTFRALRNHVLDVA